jgi:hypothetical protein
VFVIPAWRRVRGWTVNSRLHIKALSQKYSRNLKVQNKITKTKHTNQQESSKSLYVATGYLFLLIDINE